MLDKFNLQLFAIDGTTDEDTIDDNEERYGLDDKGEFVMYRGKEVIYPHTSDNDDADEDEDEDTEEDEDDSEDEDSDEDEDTEEEDEDEGDDKGDSKKNTSDDDPEIEITVQGKVEKVRLSELRKGYMRQADYTKKTQELAEQRKQAKPDSVPAKTETRIEDLEPAKFYEAVTEVAKEAVTKELGEEFDEFNPKHITALSLKTNQIMDVVKEEQALRVAQSKVSQVVETWETETRGKEPEYYDAIYDWAKENIKDVLSQREYEAAKVAFGSGDIEGMTKYFDKIASKYFETHNIERKSKEDKSKPKKIEKKKPPVGLEKSGQGDYQSKKRIAPASKLGGMNSDQQTQWLIDMGIV